MSAIIDFLSHQDSNRVAIALSILDCILLITILLFGESLLQKRAHMTGLLVFFVGAAALLLGVKTRSSVLAGFLIIAGGVLLGAGIMFTTGGAISR